MFQLSENAKTLNQELGMRYIKSQHMSRFFQLFADYKSMVVGNLANSAYAFVKQGKTGNNGVDLHLTTALVAPKALEKT